MKKTIVAGLVAICGYLLGSLPAAAIDKVEQTDDSQRVYQRQAVMVLPTLGLARTQVPVDVRICRRKCYDKRPWVFEITPRLQAQLSHEVSSWLAQKRFDVIKLEHGKLKILTQNGQQAITAKGLKRFQAAAMPFSPWQRQVERYLNTSLAPFIQPLQKAAMAQRYQALSTQERATFIRTQAKSLGLPLNVVSMLLDSQFVMALYQPATRGELTSTYIKPEGRPGYYDNTMRFDLENRLLIYQYQHSSGKFKLFKTLTGISGTVSASQKTRTYPSKRKLNGLFAEALQAALRASLIQLVHQLKEIPPFNMQQVVHSVKWRTLTATLSAQDDLRIDALYRIQRHIDGKMQTVGLAKVRTVAAADEVMTKPSTFIVVKGEAQAYDKLSEVAWMGSYWGVDLISQAYQFDTVNGQRLLQPDQKINWLKWQARMDRGYFENNPALSENWLSVYVALGIGDGELKTASATASWQRPIGLKLGMDFINHATLGRGWSFGYGFGGEFNMLSADAVQEGGEVLSYGGLDLVGKLQMTYLFSEKRQFGIYVDYPLNLFNQVRIGDIEVDASFMPGLMIGIGYQQAFSTLGFLHSFYR